MALTRYVIERDLPNVGAMSKEEMSGAAAASNAALAKLAPRVHWEHSYVAGDKTFCVFLAEDEKVIREHAELSGFPVSVITEVKAVINPATGS